MEIEVPPIWRFIRLTSIMKTKKKRIGDSVLTFRPVKFNDVTSVYLVTWFKFFIYLPMWSWNFAIIHTATFSGQNYTPIAVLKDFKRILVSSLSHFSLDTLLIGHVCFGTRIGFSDNLFLAHFLVLTLHTHCKKSK